MYVFFAGIYKPEHMALKQLCTPALIFMIYAFTQVIMDTAHGLFQTALVKICVGIVVSTTLQYLCLKGMKIISWIFVFVPLFLMTTVTSILLFGENEPIEPEKHLNLMDVREKYIFENLKPMNDLFSKDNDQDENSVIDPSENKIDVSLNQVSNINDLHTTESNINSSEIPDIQNNSVSKDYDCKYANFPDCIDQPENLIVNYDDNKNDNKNEENHKDENNTRILSFLLLRAFKNYVAKIPEKDTTENIVKLIHD